MVFSNSNRREPIRYFRHYLEEAKIRLASSGERIVCGADAASKCVASLVERQCGPSNLRHG
jgi:hypothetical protein